MSLQGFYMAVIECRALISIEEDRKTDGMPNRDFGGDCKIVVEEHTLGESPKGSGWQFDTTVYFIGKIAVFCQDGSKVGELVNFVEVDIFGTQMAKTIKLYKVHAFST